MRRRAYATTHLLRTGLRYSQLLFGTVLVSVTVKYIPGNTNLIIDKLNIVNEITDIITLENKVAHR